MNHILVVVDIQNDFVDGSLGTNEAVSIINNAVKYIESFNGNIFVTFDTHYDDYLDSSEGRKLPIKHCIKGTDGWKLNASIEKALANKNVKSVEKITFGSIDLPKIIKESVGDNDFDITLIGLCTDICVVSNALILKANFPEKDINVVADCCAGVTPQSHTYALETMKMCQINVI